MAEHSPDVLAEQPPRLPWLAAFMFGLLLLLALLIGSWFLRACAPVDPSLGLTAIETPAPPASPAPPDPTPALKAALEDEAAQQKTLKAELAALSAELRGKVAHCKLAETKPPPPPPPPPVAKPAAPPPLPADRWAQKDLGMLQGCWRLGRDTKGSLGLNGRTEICAIRAGRICFGANGSGERESTADCPVFGRIRCAAPVSARFGNDDTLGTSQPQVRCQPGATNWSGPPNSLTCRRLNDTLAICRDRLGFEHEFRRE
ncbi:MAG: hypothetical protein JOY64_07585 [Alphaproteobacteria bacterium]|nr:hypothetical protein [Alphaproteobacteria bacterium]MBV8407476.1 hypothetical protein [Alphaproteobacteria bacterium]